MIVRRLTLNNFRRFKQLDLSDIPLGLTGIIGRNGSGKSTLLEAIGWAIYGTHALTTKTGKEGVKMQGADPDAVCEVSLEFEMGGNSYKVVRRLKGKTAIASAFVYKNGSDQAAAEKEEGVNPYMERLFGMDRATFFASVFAQQKELDMLTEQTPAKRQAIIRRLLRIDLIDEAVRVIRQDGRQKAETAETMRSLILDVAAVKARIAELEEQKKELTRQVKKESEKADSLQESLKAAKALKQELDLKRKADQQVEKILVRLEKEIQNAQKLKKDRAAELDELETEKAELSKIILKDKEYISVKKAMEVLEKLRGPYEEKKGLQKELKEKHEELGRVVKAADDFAKEFAAYKGLESRKKKADENHKSSLADAKKISKEIDTLQGKIETCREALAEIEENKKRALRLGPKGKCPTCFRELGESFEAIREHFEADKEKILRQIKEHDEKVKELKVLATDAETKAEENEALLEEIRKDEKKEATLQSQIETAEKSRKSITDGINRRKSRIAEIGDLDFSEEKYGALKKKAKELEAIHERVVELQAKTQRIPDLVKEIKGLDKKLEETVKDKEASEKNRKEIGFSEKDFSAADNEYESLQKKSHEQELKIKEIRHQIDRTQDQIAQQEKALKEQKAIREKMEIAETEVKQLGLLAEVMDKFRQNLQGRIKPMLVAHTSLLLAQTTGGKYDSIDLDEEYNLYVYDGPERHLVKRFSGGEQDLISLCLRIAISRVISEQNGGNGINFIALDEIFGSQDAVRKESILQALNSLSEQFQQIFLITHHEDLKDSMQHVLTVEEVEDGVSEAAFVV